MNQNQIFKKFLQNPVLKEKLSMSKSQIDKLDLFAITEDKLLEVIKTVILYTENGDSIDLSSRRINQLFKKNSHDN
ncbi:MAG: hypothetical protein WDZ80_00215 [Candidatus Paceibacterota bacterium]